MEENKSLKEIIGLLKFYFSIILKSKYYILIPSILVSIIVGIYLYLQPLLFDVKMTYMLSEEGNNTFGAAAAILGQFGIAGGGEYNLDKVTKLSKSKSIVFPALMDSVNIGGDKDILVNHIIFNYT